MPVFPELRCAFVHIPKTAGRSVVESLARASALQFGEIGLWDVLGGDPAPARVALAVRANFRLSTLRDFPQQHLPASALRALVGDEAWSALFSFAFVRNPWDLVVSTYHFNRAHTAASAPLGIDPDLAELHARARSFAEFVKLYTVMRSDMSEMICDANGTELVDFVGRYESLAADFAGICGRLGIGATLPHLNRSEHDSYRSYYDEESREIVRAHFARDIERYGYEF